MKETTYDFRAQSFVRWIKLADEHLSAANLLAQSAPWHAAFWYHQAAERYPKACLVGRGQAFPNALTHLRRLLEMCSGLQAQFERIESLEALDRISEWEAAFAYPPESLQPDPAFPGLTELKAAQRICEGLRALASKDNSAKGHTDGQH